MKKRMRSILVGILAVIMILGLAACSQSAEAEGESKTGSEAVSALDKENTEAAASQDGLVEPKNGSTYKIGYSNNILVYNSWITLEATLEQLCGDKGWEYVVTDANGDINKQISDTEDLAAQSCDLIFVNTTDPEMLTPTINAVVEGGTPVIALDNVLSDEAKLLTTITADNRQNGYLVGEWVAGKVKGPIKAVIISGVKGEHICELRREGVLEGITESRLQTDGECSVEIVAQLYTDWYADTSISGMEDVLARNIDFNAIISEADVMTLPVYSLLEERGMADKIIFASTADAQKEALELIQSADNYATGLNSFVQQAEIAVQSAEQYFNGNTDFPDVTYTESACIARDNVMDYYDPDAMF